MKLVLDPEAIVARAQGQDAWLREARHQLDQHRRLRADPIARSRSERHPANFEDGDDRNFVAHLDAAPGQPGAALAG